MKDKGEEEGKEARPAEREKKSSELKTSHVSNSFSLVTTNLIVKARRKK